MDLHIDRKVCVLLIIAFIVGGVAGGAIGVMSSHEEGGHDNKEYGRNMMGNQFDNYADGETNDDQGMGPNQNEQIVPQASGAAVNKSATSVEPIAPKTTLPAVTQ